MRDFTVGVYFVDVAVVVVGNSLDQVQQRGNTAIKVVNEWGQGLK